MSGIREYIVLSASGEDRVGLVEELSEQISLCHGNIEDSRMALLGGEFSIIMLISGEKDDLESLKGETDSLESKLKLSLKIKNTRPPAQQRGQSYSLETVSPDSQGLVFLLTSVLKKYAINIEDLSTDIKPAPWTGTPMFHLKGTIVVPPSLDLHRLREEFIKLEGEKELDIFLKPL
jgi:glycine cleavage system transcriptional repressor